LTNLPFSFLPSWLGELRSVAVALLDRDGRLIEANQGFLATLPEAAAANVAEYVIEPPFSQWPQSAVYEGLIRLGSADGVQRTFAGKIYYLNQLFLVVAELDIAAFEHLSNEVERLGLELDEAKRQVMRRGQALQKALEEAQQLKGMDTLTGLPLRSKLDERMEVEMQRWERYRRPMALVIMDIDHFGVVNESYGRQVGDEALRHVATIVMQSVRGVDLAVRYGGQEYAALLPETNEMGALIVAERLRMELEDQIILPLVKPLTASFGVAMLLPGESPKEFCDRAERAVVTAKQSGGNCVTMAGVIAECDYVYGSDKGTPSQT
jgi:diguanylate cyclase (GGDEF)-like protein